MIDTPRIVVRCTSKELRASKRYATALGQTLSELVRKRVITPAMNHDPKQKTLPLYDDTPPRP